MQSAVKDKAYKSPVRKLARFFEKSRDQWKAKHHQAKASVKRLKNRVRFLNQSKGHWKSRAQELEREVARLKAREQALEQAVEALKKKVNEPVGLENLKDLMLVPYHHAYPIGCIALFVSLVLSAATSLRGASRAIEVVVVALHVPFACPTWFAGRLWLLRLGYYKLTRPKVHADDWVWIVDHTVQLGDDKCLVILGLRLCDLPSADRCLSHEDVEPIELAPVKKSNGEVVYQQLEQAVAKTGVPREIISDHGTDLNAGIEKFCQQHPQTSPLYDIKHKTAAVLKRELDQDANWNTFTQLANQTKHQVQQTALAALFPPNQKTKARYLNVDVLVTWGQKILTFLDAPQAAREPTFDRELVQEKLGWVTGFRSQLAEWGDLFAIIAAVESFVRHHGLYREVHLELEKHLLSLPTQTQTERTQRVRRELVAFVVEQEAKAHPDERLLGSSEVIESVLGKMKRLEQDQSKSGFTGLLLGLSALVSTTTTAVIQKALETVPTKQVWAWCQETLGQTVQAKRREAFASLGKAEQKWDQLPGAT